MPYSSTMLTFTFFLACMLMVLVRASPMPASGVQVRDEPSKVFNQKRTQPYFPDQPPSCPKCEIYDTINTCAQAAPVLANFTQIIFNPSGFIDTIKCACTDTFQAGYPQCVDCFVSTNQDDVLYYNTQDLPNVVDGMRQVCGMESTLLGNVSVANTEVPGVTPTASAALPTRLATNTLIALLSVGALTLGSSAAILIS